MVFEGLYIEKSNGKGRGVFTKKNIPVNTVIEISPVVVMSSEKENCSIKHFFMIIFLNGEKTASNAVWRLAMCQCTIIPTNRIANTKWILKMIS